MRFTPNLVVGLVITLLGALLLLDRLGALDARSLLQYWPVVLTLFGLSIVVQALRGSEEGAPASRPIVGPGFVLILIIVWIAASGAIDRRFVSSGASEDPELTLVAVMSEDTRTSVATSFREARMTSVMGRTRLDLRNATVARDEEATVDVFGLMGSVEIVVPDDWIVDVQTTAVMGGIRDRRGLPAGDDADSRRARRERRQAGGVSAGDPLSPPAAPEAQAPSPSGQEPAGPPAAAGTSTAASSPPRIVLRGIVMAGGLVIRS